MARLDYPTPHEITPSQDQIKDAQRFVRKNGAACSFNRVDYLRLEDDRLIVLEFADSNPHMAITELSEKTRNNFLKNFKNVVYDYCLKSK